jgi:hypothetical protein
MVVALGLSVLRKKARFVAEIDDSIDLGVEDEKNYYPFHSLGYATSSEYRISRLCGSWKFYELDPSGRTYDCLLLGKHANSKSQYTQL